MSNRAFYVKRYLDELNMQLAKNQPRSLAVAETTKSQITIADKNDSYRPKTVDMHTNSRSLIHTPLPEQAHTTTPTHITVATDGSLKDGEARYGFIALTQRLLEQWQSMHKLTDQALCAQLHHMKLQGEPMFRLSRMTAHTAYCSYQPEAMATVLAQTSFAAHHQLHFIIDNTSAMADLTNRASKPNRSAGRLIQKLHQRAEQQFRPHWPVLHDTKRATAKHQKSHTKQRTLPAFMNRCIDVLLRLHSRNRRTPRQNHAKLPTDNNKNYDTTFPH
jgi:hypothetical protein